MEDTISSPKKRFPRIKIKVSVGLGVLIILVVAVFGAYKLTRKHQGLPVLIGSTHITAQDVTNYANQIKAYQKVNPNSDFGGSPTQVALNDLVLNAAFKDQAQKLHKPLTDIDLENGSYLVLSTVAAKQQFIKSFHAESQMLQIRAENLAYEQKFESTLIAKKNLTIVGIDFDTPYFAQAPKSQVQTLYNQAKARVKNTVMPLFQRKATDSEINKHVDLSFKNGLLTKGNDNYQQYFQGAVLDMDVINGYTAGQNLFNDLDSTSYVRGNVGKLYGTNDQINSLKKVGDYTNVFASKAGIFMAIRLDSESGGGYNSWSDFLAHYKQQYNLTSNSLTKQLGAKVASSLNSVVLSLASLDQGQASAANIPGGCGQHNVEFTARSWDTTANVPIGGTGTTFHEYRTPGGFVCPGTVSGNASATTGGPNNTIYDNCFAPEPSWYVDSLAAGYTPVSGGPYTPNPNAAGITWDNTAGGNSVAIRSGPDTNKDGSDYDGFPIWTPGTINNTGHIYIFFLYTGHQPQCNSCTCNNNDCVGNTTKIACTAMNFQPAAGDSAEVWVTDSSGNEEMAPSNTGLNTTVAKNFQPMGQVLTLHAYDIDNGVNGGTHTWSTTGNCLTAQCSVGVDGNLPDGGVLVGSTYTVSVTLVNQSLPDVTLLSNMPANTSPDPSDHVSGISGHDLDFTTGTGPGQQYSAGGSVAPGGSYTFTFTATASSSAGPASISGYPDYFGNFGLGPSCSTGFNVETESASCSIDSVVGSIPGGYVEAGQSFTVNATVTNNGTSELAVNDSNGNPLSLNYGDNNAANSYWTFSDNNLGVTLFPGQSTGVSFTLTANLPNPPDPAQEALWAHVAYTGDLALGGQCSANVDMYVPFNLTGGASSNPKPTVEDPTSFDYKTWVDNSAPVPVDVPAVDGSTESSVYEKPAGGGTNSIVAPVPDNGPFAPTTAPNNDNILSGSAVTIPPIEAGDKYYAEIDLPFTAAYVGGGGANDIVDPTTPQPYTDDFVVQNRPFFKAYNGGLSAGGVFSSVGGACPAGSGELAGWNNDSGTQPNYGASTQLSALASGDIVGFASNQSAYNNPSTGLSFSNTVHTTGAGTDGSEYSPYLGGDFGACPTLTSASAPTSGDTSTIAGGSSLGATTISPGDNKSIFVNGDVYITGNIVYEGDNGLIGPSAAWTNTGDIPSFVLHASGNIHIAPGVTELDGLYIAEPSSGGSGGTIYTCSPGVGAIPQAFIDNAYTTCHKQLTVYGSFVANKVAMMRTFGSLRDETPQGGSPGGSQLGLVWHCGAASGGGSSGSCNSTAGLSCTSMNEPSEPFGTGWSNSALCSPPAAGVQLSWNVTTSPNTEAQAKNNSDLPYCTNWDANTAGAGAYWADDWLCSNKDLTFSDTGTIPGKYCTYINQPSDLEASNLWNSNKTYLCEPLAAAAIPAGPPSPLVCSNYDGNPRDWLSPQTCAAEVFDFSPEIYLSTPAIAPPSGGTTQYDAITSLPPVL